MAETRREQDLASIMEKIDKLQDLLVSYQSNLQIQVHFFIFCVTGTILPKKAQDSKIEGLSHEQENVKEEFLAYKQAAWEELANLNKKQQEWNKGYKQELAEVCQIIEKVSAKIEHNDFHAKDQSAQLSLVQLHLNGSFFLAIFESIQQQKKQQSWKQRFRKNTRNSSKPLTNNWSSWKLA